MRKNETCLAAATITQTVLQRRQPTHRLRNTCAPENPSGDPIAGRGRRAARAIIAVPVWEGRRGHFLRPSRRRMPVTTTEARLSVNLGKKKTGHFMDRSVALQ